MVMKHFSICEDDGGSRVGEHDKSRETGNNDYHQNHSRSWTGRAHRQRGSDELEYSTEYSAQSKEHIE